MIPSCSKCATSSNPMGSQSLPTFINQRVSSSSFSFLTFSLSRKLLPLALILFSLIAIPYSHAQPLLSASISATSQELSSTTIIPPSPTSSHQPTPPPSSSSPPPPKKNVPTTSIIDILSQSAEFSILISHLQHLGLVPLINQARNITFLAPSNNAFLDIDPAFITRDRLLYHIINTTFIASDFLQNPSTQTNIHPSFLHSQNYLKNIDAGAPPISVEKVSDPLATIPIGYPAIPVLFTKVESDSRGPDPSSYIVARSSQNSSAELVETDLKASKHRGVVQVIDKLLAPPPSICETLASSPDHSIFYSLFLLEHECSGPVFNSPTTLLVPSNSVFLDQLSNIELLYLSSDWGHDDRVALINRHTINSGLVASALIPKLAHKTPLDDHSSAIIKAADGCPLNISTSMVINGSWAPTIADIIANDGIVHFYNDFIIAPTGNIHSLINFTPEKHLLVLGAETFVKEVKFRGLRYLINGSDPQDKQTIFAPRDDSDSSLLLGKRTFISSNPDVVLKQRGELSSSDDEDDNTVFTQSIPTVMYHFIQGQHTLDIDEIINSNYLLVSKATFKRLGYGFQRIRVSANEADSEIYLNGHDLVTDGPFIVGNTTIYLIDGSLDPPPPIDLAVGSVLQSAQSATYLQQLGLFGLPASNGWTILLPTAIAWKSIGLVTRYLETNMTALRLTLESLILRAPFYSDSAPMKTKLFDGTDVVVSSTPPRITHNPGFSTDGDEDDNLIKDGKVIKKKKKKALKKHHRKQGKKKTRNDMGNYAPLDLYIGPNHYHVETANVLSSSGVIHAVNEIVIPNQVQVSSTNILESVDSTLFIALLQARNMSHVLDNSNSEESKYTILAPSNKVLEANNITVHTPDIDVLLRMHVLPGNPINDFLDGGEVLSMQDDIHLTAKEIDSGLYLVSIVEGDSLHEIRVLDRGDTTPYACSSDQQPSECKSTILYVDRFLSPDWITRPMPPFSPPFHLRTPFAILLGVVFGAILIFSVMSVALLFFLSRRRRLLKNNTASASSSSILGADAAGGSGPGSPTTPDKRPLLSRKSSAVSSNSVGGSGRRHRSSRHHSANNSPPEAPNGSSSSAAHTNDEYTGPVTKSGFYGSLDTSGMMLANDDYANFKRAAAAAKQTNGGTSSNTNTLGRRSSTMSTRSVSSMTSEHSVSEPIPTGKVLGGREHGKHLNLPRVI
ncbi:uncharacterized protein SAPINGB_P001144 [Magnusiomyces paraingens]|uniref:FAS1 domain-containing protein n=1 Tax=Magnusiomyces paraingens TaxID=2606893 RepID=A0A5E8B492_9ASCO|nr:uncharacterized protein SAPINGB_P001144 [Saprochaete ingens]VVT46298.1 unnamed protein product [Saprochaete ingens]